jgi:PD-(D/E)XK nuclease superfamily
MLAARVPAYGWRRLTNPDRWVGAYGNQRAELRLQAIFRSFSQSVQGLWSVSKERVPDIVLTVQKPDGGHLMIFDAKYRTSRSNVLDAMESAHIYQDSLRIASRRPEASLLLIPSGGGAAWLEDPTFQAEHRVGVHVLSPVADLTLPVLAERTLVI